MRVAQAVVANAEDHIVAIVELHRAEVIEYHARRVYNPVNVLAVPVDFHQQSVFVGWTAQAKDGLAIVNRYDIVEGPGVSRLNLNRPFLGEEIWA